jgi:DNA-binding MarR family transcriptional regulator
MEEAGLIRRTRIPSDRRQVMVEATSEGLDDLQDVVRDLESGDLTDALSLVERRLSRLLAAAEGAA